MKNRRTAHRWFHALVVTGAAVTACGGSSSDESATDASADASSQPDVTSHPDVTSVPDAAAPSDADAGGSIIVIDTGRDLGTDPRCCTITA